MGHLVCFVYLAALMPSDALKPTSLYPSIPGCLLHDGDDVKTVHAQIAYKKAHSQWLQCHNLVLTWEVRQASHWLHRLRRLAAAALTAARPATAAK